LRPALLMPAAQFGQGAEADGSHQFKLGWLADPPSPNGADEPRANSYRNPQKNPSLAEKGGCHKPLRSNRNLDSAP
jgi:hypothetical protein